MAALRTGYLVAGASFVAVCVIGASLAAAGPDAQGWLLAARYTARWSFVVFLVAFLGPVIAPGFNEAGTRAAILAFGAVHGIHLGALVTYRVVTGEAPGPDALAVGGLAYGLIAVLVAAELLGKSGRALRAVALHYAWFVFVLTYATRLGSAETRWVGIVGMGAGVGALITRTVLAIRNRRVAHAA